MCCEEEWGGKKKLEILFIGGGGDLFLSHCLHLSRFQKWGLDGWFHFSTPIERSFSELRLASSGKREQASMLEDDEKWKQIKQHIKRSLSIITNV